MATTDARPGFKLPWSAERSGSDAPEPEVASPAVASEATDTPAAPDDAPAAQVTVDPSGSVEQTADDSATPEAVAAAQPVETAPVAGGPFDPWRLDASEPVAEAPRRKPNKLMADLTRAMQAAAEAARSETLERFQADAKEHIESVHARSGTEAEALRRTADQDVAGIREWSKAEIARIREETDQRIADRKVALDREIETHAGMIEARIERVQEHVAAFEAEMASFFERLLAEDDPTRLAAMAENLPEPPSFDDGPVGVPAAQPAAALEPVVEADAAAEPEPVAAPEPVAEAVETPAPADTDGAAIPASTETAELAGVAATIQDDQGPVVSAPRAEVDQRLAALGLTPEAAAEAEAEAELDAAGGDEAATFSDDALNARLAGLVPSDATVPPADVRPTRIVVTGLVSVASIAGFKRQLGRFDGVSSVGVSSGPDGEFIFVVVHGPDVDLPAAIPALPGFAARVTDISDDTVTVAARDPETEA